MDTPTSPSGARLRRDLAAAGLVVSALLAVISVALQPDFPTDHAARLASLHAAGARGAISAAAFVVQQLPLLVGLLGVAHLLRPVVPRLSAATVLLGGAGAFGHAVFGGTSLVFLVAAQHPSAARAALWSDVESSPVMVFALVGLAGTVLGFVVLAIALWRAHLVPLWVPALIGVFVVLEFAGSSVSAYASDLAGLCVLVAFVALAVQLHRTSLATWSVPVAEVPAETASIS